MKKVITVIGGGAAGFFGAMAAAQANPHAEVSIIEKSPRLLVKVRMSGGGRCNVTHRCFDAKKLCEHYPRGHREMLGPFNRFGPRDMINWLKDANVDYGRVELPAPIPATFCVACVAFLEFKKNYFY